MVERIRTLLESRQLTPTQFADLIGVARPIVSHILSGRNKPSLEVVQRILAAMPELAMPWLLNGSGPMIAAENTLSAKTAPPSLATAATAPAQPTLPLTAPAAPALATASVSESVELGQLIYRQVDNSLNQDVEVPIAPAELPATKRPAGTVEATASRPSRPAPFKAAASKTAAVPKRFVAAVAPVSRAAAPSQQEAKPASPVPPVGAVPPSMEAMPEPATAPAAPAPSAAVAPSSATSHAPAAPTETPENVMAQALLAGVGKAIRRIVIFYHDGSFADYQPE